MTRWKRRTKWWRLIAVFLILSGALIYATLKFMKYVGRMPFRESTAPAVTIVIEPGMNAPAIFRKLKAAGLIRDARQAVLYYRIRGHGTLKAGEYGFSGTASLDDILYKLEKGDILLHPFTVAEGLTALQIADHLEQLGICKAADYLHAARRVSLIAHYDPAAADLEGYLFPSTYSFPAGVTANQIVAKQIETFLQRYLDLRQKENPSMGFREAVILASLVERETGQPSERPLVASVFTNRLSRHMLLQCDPTVIYALMLGGRYDGTIYRSSLTMDSPYNTYRHAGLPPGPICNPGEASLEAALYPPATQYLYFVARHDMTHIFSTSLDDHNHAVSLYQR